MKLSPVKTVRLYWQQIRKYKLLLFCLVSAMIVAYVSEVIIPIYLKSFFDGLADNTLHGAVLQQTLLHAWMVVIFLGLLRWFFYRAAGLMNCVFQPRVMIDLEQSAFEYLLGHSYRFYSNSFAGSLARRISRYGRSFEMIADQLQWDILKAVILIGGSLYIFYGRQPLLALMLAIWVVVFLIANLIFSYWKLPYDEKRAEIDSEVSGKIADALSNSVTIMQFSGLEHERDIMQEVNDRLRKIFTFTWSLSEYNIGVQVLLMIVLEYLTISTVIKYYVAGELTLGDFALIQGALVSIFGVLWNFGRVMRQIYEGFADAHEMVEILEQQHEVQDAPNAKQLRVTRGQLEFDGVGFGYSAERQILSGLSFLTSPQEKIAFVGSSGAGKSTVVKLLLRFFDVQKGTIKIDGQDIAHATQATLRDAISLVPQDPALFHRTVMENIRYGRREATDDEVFAAAKKAHCDEFIRQLTDGYNTMVGERGVKLSGGERQRVAIARAILKNSPILILDEATSSLDSESEAFIQDALHSLMQNKTVIVIAHRLSTIMLMDRILVVEDGHVVDQGTHEELYKRSGKYSRLWKIQAGGFKAKKLDAAA